jgi:hypothetical protein
MLKIFYNSTEYSKELENYSQDTVTITQLSTETIDVGLYKPINALYFEFQSANTNSLDVSVKYFNGTSFTNLTINDRTNNFKRSGFISWDRNQTTENKTTLHSQEMYWYRISVSSDTTAMVLKGINLVFSDDQSLQEEYPGINKYLPTGQTSFINFHQSVRDDIIQMLRNSGKKVKNANDQKNLDQFDLLDFKEVTQAAKYYCLAKIFFWQSDEVDDKWYQKAKDYQQMADSKINLIFISIDDNDDGMANQSEKLGVQFVRIARG